MRNSKRSRVDVVVVGAGLSGLRTATLIQAAGFSCVSLEAMDRVGGKTLSHKLAKGGVVDLGAAWINDSNQSAIYELAQQFGFELIEQRATGLSLHQVARNQIKSFPHGSMGSIFPPEDAAVLRQFLDKLNRLVDSHNLNAPTEGPDSQLIDSVSLASYAQKHFGPQALALSNSLSRGFLGVDAEEVSVLFFIDYVKSGTGLANMSSDTKHGGQYLRNRQGNQSFSVRLSEMLEPNTLLLSSPVTQIDQVTDGHCLVHTSTGLAIECKRVVVSIPTTLYPSIRFQPPLPPPKQLLGEETALGYYSKMIFVFEEAWWRDVGLSGTFSSDIGPIGFSRDTCSEQDGQFSITCFIIGNDGRCWSKFSKVERRRQAVDQFYNVFETYVPSGIPDPIDILEKEWSKTCWIQGAPSPVMMPGVMTGDAGKEIRTSIRNIHFVGTETALVWKGYMEGAIRSGIRGAGEVISSLSSQS